jgi:transposase-like protein/IS1 family transposase
MARKLPVCPHCGSNSTRLHASYMTKTGRKRRYKCLGCGPTFSRNTKTVYEGIHGSRNEFDDACQLSVEGVNRSAIARFMGRSWNTIDRWLKRATRATKQFTNIHMRDYVIRELQADELCTYVSRKIKSTWVITMMEVGSRLWLSFDIGRRTYKRIRRMFREAFRRADPLVVPFIVTDGNSEYANVLKNLFEGACVYGQVIKGFKRNRVVVVDRRLVIGTEERLADMLYESEDSEKLNTAFIERLNLTIRQGSSYLRRKSAAHAREGVCLHDHLSLLHCYYNFIRPHRSLRFGNDTWTPAMVAGIAKRRHSFRSLFESVAKIRSEILVFTWPAVKMVASDKCAA